jgi:hypothetical protein
MKTDIPADHCTEHPSKRHIFEPCQKQDFKKGFNYYCPLCGMRFHLLSENQMVKLQEIFDIKISVRPPTEHN